MNKEELNKILADHLIYLQTGDKSKRANLRDANLSDANLSGADLRYSNLSDANLSGANLSYANLSDANLSDANQKNYQAIQVINTKYFITILHDKVLWGCRTFTHDELENFSHEDCKNLYDKEEFELNKKHILENIKFYFGKDKNGPEHD